jgi:hypothetical protein
MLLGYFGGRNFLIYSMRFIYILFFLWLSGCSQQYKITPNGYYAPPPGQKYRLAGKFTLTDTSKISTSATYKFACGDRDWFKFFPDGRVFYGYMSQMPKGGFEDYFGFPGYFKLDGNKITIELNYAQKDWYFLMLEGEIKGDTIIFYKDHERHSRRNIFHFTRDKPGCGHYIKLHTSNILRPPDW